MNILLYQSRQCSVLSFFFQAEDGIRDSSVTGVQTCALPIYARKGRRHPGHRDEDVRLALLDELHERPRRPVSGANSQLVRDPKFLEGVARLRGDFDVGLGPKDNEDTQRPTRPWRGQAAGKI